MGVVKVTDVRNLRRKGLLITCDTNVYKNYDKERANYQALGDDVVVCISGEATVWVPSLDSRNLLHIHENIDT